jgi:transposase-like protein
MEGTRRVYEEAFKRQVVEEVESGRLSPLDASREYGVTKSLVRVWLDDYGRFRPKRDIVEVVMKSEKDRIAELEKALAEAHLKIRVTEELLNQAEKKYGGDLKKTVGLRRPDDSSGRVLGWGNLRGAQSNERRVLQRSEATT